MFKNRSCVSSGQTEIFSSPIVTVTIVSNSLMNKLSMVLKNVTIAQQLKIEDHRASALISLGL